MRQIVMALDGRRKAALDGRLLALACVVVASWSGCGSTDRASKDEPAAAASGTQGGPAVPAQPQPVTEPAVAQPAAATASPGAQPGGAAAAAGRSAVPTTAEWDGVGEVTVRGSSALACETKAVREWIRVSCRGDDPARGKPTRVTVERGGGAETFTFASGGVTSLVFPFEQGTDVQALFAWDRQSHRLVAQWPRGAPRPTAYGQFVAAR